MPLAESRVHVGEIGRKVAALEIIFAAPLWPKREDLSESGQALFDALVRDGKPFALHVADGEFSEALRVAGEWSPLVNWFMDSTRIKGDEAAERMLQVYRYYCDQIADFSKVERV